MIIGLKLVYLGFLSPTTPMLCVQGLRYHFLWLGDLEGQGSGKAFELLVLAGRTIDHSNNPVGIFRL